MSGVEEMDRLLVAKDAAAILNISPARLYHLVRQGLIPPGVVVLLSPRSIRFNEVALRQWIAGGGLLSGKQPPELLDER